MGLRKKKPTVPDPTRLSKFSEEDLINLVESSISNAGTMYRGLSHSELERGWVLAQLETHFATGLEAARELLRRAVAPS